jgi:hypothetical protein
LESAPDYESGGREFESPQGYFKSHPGNQPNGQVVTFSQPPSR